MPALQDRLQALDALLALGEGRLEPALLDDAARLRTKASERLAKGDGLVVAALCGGTGVGKSSLFNALAGAELSEVGPRRPTTADARALVVADDGGGRASGGGAPGGDGAGPLLDWLGVDTRHQVSGSEVQGLPAGLVVLDLPDHDSVELDHHLVVDALVERVDVLVWVVDPVKYAHAGLHESYLGRLAAHADVVVAVLNRVDELTGPSRSEVLADLRRLLEDDGLDGSRVLATSAATGEGLAELRALLAEEGEARRAATLRLTADLQHLAASSAALGDGTPEAPSTDGMVDALTTAVGVEPTAAASSAEYRLDARAGSRSLLMAPLAALVALVLRPIRGVRGLFDRKGPQRRRRASEQAGGATPLTVRHAGLRLLEEVMTGLPQPWRDRLQLIVGAEDGRLVRSVRSAVDAVPLRPPRRRWWRAVALLRTVIDAVAAVGAIWLFVLGVLAWLRLPEPPTPMMTEVLSLPTALLLGALLVRLVIGGVVRFLVRIGARRHHRAVASDLREAVEQVVRDEVAKPLAAELDVHAELRGILRELGA